MVTTMGNCLTGYTAPDNEPDLPRANGRPPAHRPWCAHCKVKHDADQLDAADLCAPCSASAGTRAAAAERRRLADLADATPYNKRKAAKAARGSKGLLEDHRAAVIERYEAGETAASIGTAYGVRDTTVLKFLHRNDVAVRKPGTGRPKRGAA